MLDSPSPTTAPRHRVPLLHPFRWVYTGSLNVMEFPATQVPLGLGSEGLPRAYRWPPSTATTISASPWRRSWSASKGGWVPPELARPGPVSP